MRMLLFLKSLTVRWLSNFVRAYTATSTVHELYQAGISESVTQSEGLELDRIVAAQCYGQLDMPCEYTTYPTSKIVSCQVCQAQVVNLYGGLAFFGLPELNFP